MPFRLEGDGAVHRCSLRLSCNVLITWICSVFFLLSPPLPLKQRLVVLVIPVGAGIIKAFLGICVSSRVKAAEVKWRQQIHHQYFCATATGTQEELDPVWITQCLFLAAPNREAWIPPLLLNFVHLTEVSPFSSVCPQIPWMNQKTQRNVIKWSEANSSLSQEYGCSERSNSLLWNKRKSWPILLLLSEGRISSDILKLEIDKCLPTAGWFGVTGELEQATGYLGVLPSPPSQWRFASPEAALSDHFVNLCHIWSPERPCACLQLWTQKKASIIYIKYRLLHNI